MARKTRKQKIKAAHRTTSTLKVEKGVSVKAKATPKYHETTYDKELRAQTLKDTGKTLLITALLFGLQYFFVLQQDLIKGFFG